jgi:integrase
MTQKKTKKKRRQHDGLRKLCACKTDSWPSCSHPYHFNYKPTEGPLAGTAFRLSLDRYAKKHLDSKRLAESVAAKVRTQIDAGTFGKQAPPLDAITMQHLCDRYMHDFVRIERAGTVKDFTYALKTILATRLQTPTGGVVPFGEWRLQEVTFGVLKQFKQHHRERGAGVVGTNRLLRRLRAMFNWGMDDERRYTTQTPFTLSNERRKLLFEKEHARTRRLNPPECRDEEQRLLAACAPHVRAMVECALETGMRRGEILSLQWSEVHGLTVQTHDDGTRTMVWAPRPEIALPAAKTKTRTARRIPISARLKAVLEGRRLGPDQRPLPFEAYVFGTEIGTRVQRFTRAWNRAVLQTRGITATYTATMNLDPACRTALAAIGLHFHDLRREAGSRWLEGGTPLHVIRDWLGHTNISMTSTYLGANETVSHDFMARLDAQRETPLQPIATKSVTARLLKTRSAPMRHTKPNKAAVDPHPTIM